MQPRLYCIAASNAPIVAVLRRGPTAWAHVGRWELDPPAYVPGSWLHATLYPQRCDLSADGRWLAYFALDASARWAPGDTYVALSRLPWVTALAAWGTHGTWSRGVHFVDDVMVQEVSPPDVGGVDIPVLRQGIAVTHPASFAVERRRGWTESSDTPRRSPHDMWDEGRGATITMTKPQPGNGQRPTLVTYGRFAATRSGATRDATYAIQDTGAVVPLLGVQWADWAADGSLLVATWDGWLHIRSYDGGATAIQWQFNVGALEPDPQPSPPVAHGWR